MADSGSGYDGSIRIRTKLDNSGIGADIADLRAKLDSLGEKLGRLGSGASFERMSKELSRLKTKLVEISSDNSGEHLQRQFENAQTEVVAYEQQLTEMTRRLDRMKAEETTPMGTFDPSAEYQKLAQQIEATGTKLAAAEDRQKTAEEKLTAYTANRTRAVEELGEAYDRLSAKADAALSAQTGSTPAAPTVDNTGSEQTLSIWQRIGGAIKVAAIKVADFAKKTRSAAASSRKTDNSTKKIGNNMRYAANATRSFGAMLERIVKRIIIFRIVNAMLKAAGERFKTLISANASLSKSLAQLKGSFLMAFQPLLDVAVPVLTTIFRIASKVFKVIAAIIAALFGKTVQQAASSSAALDQEAQSLTGVGNAAKKASKSLANFDEINTLQNPDTGAGGGGGGSLAGGGTIIPEYDTSGLERVYEWLERIKNSEAFQRLQAVWDRFKDHTLETLAKLKAATVDWFQNTDFSPLANSFAGLMEKLEPLVELIEDGLYWAYTNVLLPIATWAVEELAPAGIDTLSAAIQVVYDILVLLKPYGEWLWDNFLKPIAEWTGEKVVEALGLLKTALDDLHTALGKLKEFLDGEITFDEFVGSLSTAEIAALAVAIAIGIVVAGLLIYKIAMAAASAVTWLFNTALTVLTSPITLVIVAIAALVAGILLLIKNWDKVKATAKKVWDWIKRIWGQATTWFKEKVIDPITKFFTDLWDGIKEGAKVPINAVLGFAEGFVNKFIDGLNFLIRAINKISFTVPDWVPLIGGSSVGFNLAEVGHVTIPRLAQGAVIPPNAPFLAMLGDQKRGTNIEAPLDTLVAAFKAAQKDAQPQTVNIRFTGSLAQLGQVLKPVIEAENRRVGTSFVTT